jgi:hypothetical protein
MWFLCRVFNIRNGTFSAQRLLIFYSISNWITIIFFYYKVHRWASFLRYCLLVEYCVIMPSGLTFFIYADFWAQALAGSFRGLYKTLRTAVLGNDRSHTHVSTQTVKFGKRIFSHKSAWLPTVQCVLYNSTSSIQWCNQISHNPKYDRGNLKILYCFNEILTPYWSKNCPYSLPSLCQFWKYLCPM